MSSKDKQKQKQVGFTSDALGLLVHSYNNYLSGVLGFAELALMECEQDEVKKSLELILVSGNQAVDFGKQLLSATSRLHTKLDLVEFSSIVTHIKSNTEASLNLQMELTNKYIKTDLLWFSCCLTSTIRFFLDFTQQSQIEISITEKQNATLIVFQLAATEFTQIQADSLFDPFYSSRHLLGTQGLGLSYIKGFVEQMQGVMYWDSKVGIVISVPLQQS